MVELQADKGSSTQLQATLGTVLETIWGIQRSNQTTMEAMEKSFEEKLKDLRELSEKQEKACNKLLQKMKENEKYQFRK